MDLRDISINAMCEPYLHLDLNKVLKKREMVILKNSQNTQHLAILRPSFIMAFRYKAK